MSKLSYERNGKKLFHKGSLVKT